MQTLKIGDVTITSIVERDGPWRKPEDMFPAYDPASAGHLDEMEPIVFDPASGRMVITYQTFVVRTPKHTILIDTCTGEDKGYRRRWIFTSSPGSTASRAAGLSFDNIDLRVLHPSAYRSLRLEHAAARRPLGSDLSERQICLSQARIRLLGGGDRARRQPARQVWR